MAVPMSTYHNYETKIRPQRDHMADARRQDEAMNRAANELTRRLDGVERLYGLASAAVLRHPAEALAEAATELAYVYSARIAQLEAEHEAEVHRMQVRLSDANVSLARGIVIVRLMLAEAEQRRLKSFDAHKAAARVFLAEHEAPF